ncbi:MAG: hypothetical protein LBU32_20690 [Clostridiales bacterium]|jgi:hypothetical protein|nr:hypothetical protein [Clostridiales bacterium]
MSNSFAGEFLEAGLSEGMFALPEELSERFDVLERLSANDFAETYLLAEKVYAKRLALKRCRKSNKQKIG